MNNVFRLNTRRHQRKTVEFHAEIELGESLIVGTIRDWSIGGLCFQPEAAYVDGELLGGGEVLRKLYIDEILRVIIRDPKGQFIDLPVQIKWKGKSIAHECRAFGCEFLANDEKLAA